MDVWNFRLKALEPLCFRSMPTWYVAHFGLKLDDIFLWRVSSRPEGPKKSWDDVPDTIKNTFDKLGIPEAERKFLAGGRPI